MKTSNLSDHVQLHLHWGGGSGILSHAGTAEYYTKSVERPGEWFGKGAEVLRLRYAKRASKAKRRIGGWNIKPV